MLVYTVWYIYHKLDFNLHICFLKPILTNGLYKFFFDNLVYNKCREMQFLCVHCLGWIKEYGWDLNFAEENKLFPTKLSSFSCKTTNKISSSPSLTLVSHFLVIIVTHGRRRLCFWNVCCQDLYLLYYDSFCFVLPSGWLVFIEFFLMVTTWKIIIFVILTWFKLIFLTLNIIMKSSLF